MPEFIIYKGIVPFVRFSKQDATAAVATGEYRWNLPAKKVVVPEQSSSDPIEKPITPLIEWEEPPNEDAVNLNTASLQELTNLPGGIGISTARKIVNARPLQSVDDAISLSNRVQWQKLSEDKLIYFGEPEAGDSDDIHN